MTLQNSQDLSAQHIIRVKDQFYILASSSLADDRVRVLKQGETFAVFDRHGDMGPVGLGVQGLYHHGTRYLSRLELRLGNDRPMFLSSTVTNDNALLTVDLTNQDAYGNAEIAVCRGTVHLSRSMFLWEGRCYECLKIWNYGLVSLDLAFSFQFEADFSDIFEVRGMKRKQKGRRLDTVVDGGSIVLAYEGLDGVIRRTRLECIPAPKKVSGSLAQFETRLEPKAESTVYVIVSCESMDKRPPRLSYQDAFSEVGKAIHDLSRQDTHIYTSNEQFNDWVNRSIADLHMMVTQTPEGPYPYAGVPWFSTPFGRDGLITAMASLWINPQIARGVLAFLAATQATSVVPEQDAEPGKILHETRRGEMAALGEIPFGRYYGSVDAAPLFVMLAGDYYQLTGDVAFIRSIWPNIDLALQWLDTYGDADRDGFVEYARHTPQGLDQQGWKDSKDSVFHADGTLAEGPIALCEVQAYVYGSRIAAAHMALSLGMSERADALLRHAEELRQRFEQLFWCEDLSTYVLALDGKKRPCRVRTSNAGHCLLTGIVNVERAWRMAQGLLEDDCFSGWGIRTLAASEVRYNPMSYHNGSVWPHDNALIASGFARYGLKEPVFKILTGLFDASIFLDLHRLPELFCGFVRRPGEGPTLYPVACSPQAWASGSVFQLLQACLGLSIHGATGRLIFTNPVLPPFLEEVRISNLKVGKATVDLLFQRYPQDVSIRVLRMDGQVVIEKTGAGSSLF
ncbi:MAG: amylo-alpha-1,6-glucosidase [Nitrospiraceae bacterium]